MKQYQLNEEVSWLSMGNEKRLMRGRVLAAIPPFTDPITHVGLKSTQGFRITFSSKLRDHLSYLCVVPATPGTRQPTLCWPRVKDLQHAPREERTT